MDEKDTCLYDQCYGCCSRACCGPEGCWTRVCSHKPSLKAYVTSDVLFRLPLTLAITVLWTAHVFINAARASSPGTQYGDGSWNPHIYQSALYAIYVIVGVVLAINATRTNASFWWGFIVVICQAGSTVMFAQSQTVSDTSSTAYRCLRISAWVLQDSIVVFLVTAHLSHVFSGAVEQVVQAWEASVRAVAGVSVSSRESPECTKLCGPVDSINAYLTSNIIRSRAVAILASTFAIAHFTAVTMADLTPSSWPAVFNDLSTALNAQYLYMALHALSLTLAITLIFDTVSYSPPRPAFIWGSLLIIGFSGSFVLDRYALFHQANASSTKLEYDAYLISGWVLYGCVTVSALGMLSGRTPIFKPIVGHFVDSAYYTRVSSGKGRQPRGPNNNNNPRRDLELGDDGGPPIQSTPPPPPPPPTRTSLPPPRIPPRPVDKSPGGARQPVQVPLVAATPQPVIEYYGSS